MRKKKIIKFDDVMAIYTELFPKGKEVRLDSANKILMPKTVAERIRETIKLSEQLIWKKPTKNLQLDSSRCLFQLTRMRI